MEEDELYAVLDCALWWMKNHKKQIVDLIAGIAEDIDCRDQLSKAIAMIIDDVNAWMKEWR